MAANWSGALCTVTEYKDLQATTLAVDYHGQFALLAGRRYLLLVELDNPDIVVKKISRQSKWEVGSSEWSPHRHSTCAITSNQRIELLTLKGSDLICANVLRCHTRTVSDLHWHRQDPNLLATCSVDTFIHIWDVREPRRPHVSFSAVVGAGQVRWNRLNSYMLATAHDGDVRIWDMRKGNSPVQYVAAHLCKIHGLDWSYTNENQLATSSQDCTVKFFDINNPRKPESILRTSAPVWRARFTPFGDGLVTVVVPQLRRGDNSLMLWSLNDLNHPVHSFVGHTDVVVEFDWRRKDDCGDFELVTWSKDQSLRVWKLDPYLQRVCGYDPDVDEPSEGHRTNYLEDKLRHLPCDQNADETLETGIEAGEMTLSLTPRESKRKEPISVPASSLPETQVCRTPFHYSSVFDKSPLGEENALLEEEWHDLRLSMESCLVLETDTESRMCKTSFKAGKHFVSLRILFPVGYPTKTFIPDFQFEKGCNLDPGLKYELIKGLKQTAQHSLRTSSRCLEPCLRYLMHAADTTVGPYESESSASKSYVSNGNGHVEASSIFGPISLPTTHNQDHNIPYARSSGARFCSTGVLVCFGRPSYLKRVFGKGGVLESSTPRSLSHGTGPATAGPPFAGLMYRGLARSPTSDSSGTPSSFYYQEKDKRQKGKQKVRSQLPDERKTPGEVKPHKVGVVTIYDATGLVPIRRELAAKYVFKSSSVVDMCHTNAMVAAANGRKDLIQVWSLAALTATPELANSASYPWAQTPLGRQLLHSMIEHYAKQRDVQTVAMLCCTFDLRTEQEANPRRKITLDNGSKNFRLGRKLGESPYHTIHPMDTSLDGWNISAMKQTRSNSWSDSNDDLRTNLNLRSLSHLDLPEETREKDLKLLDSSFSALFDNYRKAYADILYRWGELEARAQVLKYLCVPPESHKGVELVTECHYCKQTVRGPQCLHCKRWSFRCSICHIAVKGSSSFCLLCGHGGHSLHLTEWFLSSDVCPTGCGCSCPAENAYQFS